MKTLRLFLGFSMLLSMLAPVLPVAAAPLPGAQPASASAELLPAWMQQPAAADTSAELLPAWFEAAAPRAPDLAPSRGNQIFTPIPASLLTVNVTGPAFASLGSPPGLGETYTAIIRNNSGMTAYGVYLSAEFPGFFVHDGGDSLSDSGGAVGINTVAGSGYITWTVAAPPYNLAPGEVLTLTFRLRAVCNAESGQQMRVRIHYNADPPPALPTEMNTGGLNITTGRGNLVINKTPALQNLGTPDFGQPITWTVIVQNTGLGILYNAIITDTGGINLGQPGGDLTPSVVIPSLDINEIVTFTVVGTVEACNFTNVAQAAWPCGNQVGDATYTNPLRSTASVLFTPQIPRVQVQISPIPPIPYCTPLTRTVYLTITNTGGPAGSFRLDSTYESDAFWNVLPATLSPGWSYDPATGIFSYTGGTPAGTLPNTAAGGPIYLSFDVAPQPNPICSQGSGSVAFEPLFRDVCTDNPFTANPVETSYAYGAGLQPTLNVTKDGPQFVQSGQTFIYTVTVSGNNPDQIAGPIVITDTLPDPPFTFIGPLNASAGVAGNSGGLITWVFTPTANPYNETLTYVMQVLTDTNSGGLCEAGQIVANQVQARAYPSCVGCPLLEDFASVDTAILNNEGVFPGGSAAGNFEVCGAGGFTINNHYLITGSTVVNWAGAVFTEALGTGIGAGGLPGPDYLEYIPGSLIVTVNGVDYTAFLTPITTTGQLVIDLSPLAAAGVPTQNLTIAFTYTVSIPESALNGAIEQTFYDWSQLFLPGVSDIAACAGNGAFNQALALRIERGDLTVGLEPRILNRCDTNPVVISVNDNRAGRLTDHIVITYTASAEEIASARNFAFTGTLAAITPITIDIGTTVITFTLPPTADLNGSGEIHFEVDVDCTLTSIWTAGVRYQSQCAFAHRHATTRDHLYRAPGLILFATPIRYTVRENTVMWKFFVTNNGNYTATNIVVTNDLFGLNVTGFTSDEPTIIGALGAAAVFTVPVLGPNQMRAVTVTADVLVCSPLRVELRAIDECFGDACYYHEAQVDFDTPDPYLLTNNGQSADLPMCDIGYVEFTTKNASADVTLYQLNITETLRGLTPVAGAPITLTILNAQGVPVASTTAFTPTPSWNGPDLQLTWLAADAPPAVATWFDALPPLYVVRIQIPVQTACTPPATPQSFASASALGPCNQRLDYTENAVTLRTLAPDMYVTKQGKVAGGTFGDTVYASPGDTIVWRIEAENVNSARSYLAQNVVLSDTWPANFNFITASLNFPVNVIMASRTITWDVGDMLPGVTHYFYITGTVTLADDACTPETLNNTRLRFGCDFDGCTSALTPMDSASLTTNPALTVQLSPGPLNTCLGDIPITISNSGSRAYTNVLTLTIPAGYVYDHVVSTGLTITQIITDPTTPVFRWDEIPGHTGGTPYEFTLVVRLRNSASTGSCPIAHGAPIAVALSYDNHATCATTGPFTTSDSVNLVVQDPNLTIDKTPPNQTLAVGDPVAWTLTVQNTGSGMAYNVVVTDIAGSNYINVAAMNGSDGAVPIVSGNAITWFPNPIPAGGTWTAQVTAILTDTGENINRAWVRSDCDTGCETAAAQDTAHTTLVQEFGKTPDSQSGTIGDLVVFNLAASLSDWDALYQNLILTDFLPAGLGYVAAVLTYTYDVDGSDGGPFGPVVAPISAPVPYNTGNVIWNLGNLSGTIQINGVITAVIRDVGGNYNGALLTNLFRMTYTDDGIPYQQDDTATVTVLEPLLHIGKTYVTPLGCNATLLQTNFNSDGLIPPWLNPSGLSGWSIINGMARNNSNASNRRIYQGDVTWTDYSFSAMVMSTDASGDIGLIFRSQAADQNYYRFIWSRSASINNYRLQRVVSGGATTLGTVAGTAYQTNRWYHIEIQAIGNRFLVYIDGALVLDRTDPLDRFPAGRIGLYANNQNAVYFDDILVTRLDEMACTVGAGDLVTYTLTISNQAQLPAYDLVITDMIPAGTSLWSYTLSSSDPTAAVVVPPAPIPGATGALVWQVNHLTPTVPFNPLSHTYINLQVVLKVSEQITANIVLANQAFLVYDGQEGTGPVGIGRDYSGGSHSTAIRTVNGGLIKTVDFSPPPTATLGTVVTYTLIVPATPISATLYDVNVTDTINSRLSIEGVTTSGGTGAASGWLGQLVTATFASIPHSTQAFITITAIISDPLGALAGDIIPNVAEMTHATAPITTSNQVDVEVGEPLLMLVKASDPPTSNTVGAGDSITYAVTITNIGDPAGPAPAYDIVFTDTLPTYANDAPPLLLSITLDGVPVAPALYTPNYVGGVYTIIFAPTFAFSIPVGSVLVIQYVATVDADVGAGLDLMNTAQVSWSSLPGATPGDRDYSPIADDTTVHTVLPDIIKTVTPITASIGTPITYTIRVPETPITATLYNVIVTDQFSPWLELANVVAPLNTTQAIEWGPPAAITITYATIPAGQQRTITVTAYIADGSTEPVDGDIITNVVTLEHDTGIITSPPVTVTVVEPFVTLVKSVVTPRDPLGASDIITYNITLENSGNWPAYDLVITDSLPVGLTYIGEVDFTVTDPATATTGGAYPQWTLSQLNVGGQAIIRFRAQVNADIGAGITLTNTAWGEYSGLPGDNPDEREYDIPTDTVPVDVGHPVLDLVKSADPDPVEAGGLLTYTLTVANTGIVSATGVIVTDAVPLNTSYLACGPLPCGEAGGSVSWILGTLDVNETQVLTMLVQVNASLPNGAILTNTAWVSSSEGITDTDTITTPVETSVEIWVIKTGSASPVTPGEVMTYSLTVTNDGPSDAENVVVTDTLPVEVTFGNASPAPDSSPNPLVWNLGTLTPGESRTILITVTVNPDVTTGFTNTVIITTTTPGDNPGNNEDDWPVNVLPDVEIWVVKSGSASPVTPGLPMTYSLTVTNDGPSDAENVVVTDTLPVEVTFGSASPAPDSSPNPLVWNLGTLTPGESRTLLITVTVNADVTAGFTNTVIITTTTPGDDPGNNQDDWPVDVLPDVEIWVLKTGSASPVTPGEVMTYSLTVTNDGPSDAENVVVTDTLPVEVTFGSATPAPDSSPNPLVWNLGTLTPGESRTLLITVTVNADVTAGFTNTVIITTTTPGDDPGNNEDDWPVDVQPDVEIWVLKTGSASPVTPGEVMTYSLTITNDGPSNAENVVVTDTLPAEVTFGSASPAPDSSPNPLVWQLGTLTPGESREILITVTVNADVTTGFTNTVIITTTTPGDDPGNNQDDWPVDVLPDVEIWVLKTGSASPVTPGAVMTYSLTVTNDGPSAAENVVVTDTLPVQVTFVAANPPQNSGPNPLVWLLGTLGAGESRTLLITVTVNADVMVGFTNTVIITTTTPGDNPGNNQDDWPVDVTPRADLGIVKTDSHDPVIPGTLLTYTLRVTNYGPSVAENVIVTDTLPAEVIYISAAPAHTYTAPDTVIWGVGTLLPGEERVLTLTVQVQLWATQTFTNGVVVGSDTPDDNPGNNQDDEPTTPLVPGLTILKTVLPGASVPNMPFTYVIVITNTGQVVFDPIMLTDTLPTLDFHYVVGSATPSEPTSITPPQLVWANLGALNPGETLTVTFAVTVSPGITIGTYWNVALIEGEHPGGVITDTDDVPISIQDPAINLSKHLVDFDTNILAPNYVTFTIFITNVGISTIDILPVYDLYNADYIHFAYAFPAIPNTVDNVNGQVLWLDLTAPAPYGFGRNLLPGEVFSLTTVFTVVQTINTPITNTAIVSDATDIFDNPPPPADDSETIVDVPTAITLRYFRATGLTQGVLLEWATAVEIDNFGFNLYRATEPDFTRASLVNFTPSACRGNLCGAEYAYTDETSVPEVSYWYWLADVDMSGVETRHGPVNARMEVAVDRPYKLFLPLLLRTYTQP